jgi:hypothetical protein
MIRTSITWFILTCRREIIFRCKVNYGTHIILMHVSQKLRKVLKVLLESWPFIQGCELQPVLVPCLGSTDPFSPRSAPCLAPNIPFFPTHPHSEHLLKMMTSTCTILLLLGTKINTVWKPKMIKNKHSWENQHWRNIHMGKLTLTQ